MSLKQKLTENWRNGAIGASSAVFLGLVLLMSPLGNGFTHWSYDFPFAWRAEVDVDDVAIIYMDEDSHKNLYQERGSKWHPALHAQLLNSLSTQNVRAVVFDVLFDEPWPDTPLSKELAQLLVGEFGLSTNQLTGRAVDRLFSDAIQAHGKVVLAASCKKKMEKGEHPMTTLLDPRETLGSNVVWGIVEFPDETDKVIRRHNQDWGYTNMAWKVAELIGEAPAERVRKRWINYYGPPMHLAHCSYHEVFKPGLLSSNYFSGKVVFVGKDRNLITSQGSKTGDEFSTPYTRGATGDSPGVEIQATAFLNLKRGDWLEELSPTIQFIVVLSVGLLLGYGFTLLRPWVSTGLALVIFFVLVAVALALVWKQRLWFPWLVVGLQIPVALGWAILSNTKKVYHEKEVLEETLSKVKSGVLTSPSSEGATQMAIALPGGRMVKVGPGGTGTDGNTFVVTAAGPQIPDHQLVRCIGKGAYGEVWLARDIIGSYHAVKIVYRKSFSNDGPFEREFKGIQKFTPISRSHPGFVHVLHVGRNEAEGYFYYIMEVGDDEVSGQNIDPATYSAKNLAREIQNRGKLPMEECLQLSLDLTAALDFLHQQQLIHRDIKPSNIIFVNDVPKIADIGLVTSVAEKGKDVTYIGTDGYIPPEGPGSPAADVYSLGKVLYETAMGRSVGNFPELPSTLFERRDHRELLQFNEIILKACEVNAAIRYKTAGQMRADLLQLQSRVNAQRKV